MTPRSIDLDSDALRANQPSTAVEVRVPARFEPLLAEVAELVGASRSLQSLLTEYFHDFRNDDAAIEALKRVLLRDWAYFERSPARAGHYSLFADMALDLLEGELSDDQASNLLHLLTTWTGGAVDGLHGPAYLPAVEQVAVRLRQAFPRYPEPFRRRDRLLRGLLVQIDRLDQPVSGAAAAWGALYADVLESAYRDSIPLLDAAAWARECEEGEGSLNDADAVKGAFAGFDRGVRPPATQDGPQDLLELPTLSELRERAMDAVPRVADVEDRFSLCLFLLRGEVGGPLEQELTAALVACVREMMDPERGLDYGRVIDRLSDFFRAEGANRPAMRFRCYEVVGVAIGEVGARRAADHLIDDLLTWPFEHPEANAATDDWRTVVNPHHLANIRCWLSLIRSNPTLFERLAAALTVQLRLGGVFLADTDLFQRDISRLLATDLKPVWFTIKQLLRSFPVYFNELGAEGELRSVSTEIDELTARGDTLMHFLRKQVHAESSSRLLGFCRAVREYWGTLDPAPLEDYLSPAAFAAVAAQREFALGPHRVLAAAEGGGTGDGDTAATGEGPRDEGPSHEGPPDEDLGRRRVALLARLQELLELKYASSSAGLAESVSGNGRLSSATREEFLAALAAWKDGGEDPHAGGARAAEPTAAAPAAADPTGAAAPTAAPPPAEAKGAEPPNTAVPTAAPPGAAPRARLLDACLDLLIELKLLILDPTPTDAQENIYHKRHIAAGIPSMYGSYREPKFDALSLSLRVEGLLGRLLEAALDQSLGGAPTRTGLSLLVDMLRRFQRALQVDGLRSQAFEDALSLIEAGLVTRTFTHRQYRDALGFLAQSVSDLSRRCVLMYDEVLKDILRVDPRPYQNRRLTLEGTAEAVLRELLVSISGLQVLDRYLSSALRELSSQTLNLGEEALTSMAAYDPERLVAPIHEPAAELDDQVTLGAKALGLKQLAALGYRVPEGFILTTELFHVLPALEYPPLRRDTEARIGRAVEALEADTGRRLGDPERLLTLSVRSGAAISMPGLMTTFVNVGLNRRLTEAVAKDGGWTAWSAWDSYRRFLQSWAMAGGVDRDEFDRLIAGFKTSFEVEHKIDFTAEQMREIALSYEELSRTRGVVFLQDPFEQLVACVHQVLASWQQPQARFFRNLLGMSDDWGTAVIVQRMVLGNLGPESGAGVVLTRDPNDTTGHQIRLFGDYGVATQGEDLVSGLVNPWPISRAQRLSNPALRAREHSLERDFPAIYQALLELAHDLILEQEYDPQEIEFTFEGPTPEDLHLLQRRTMVESTPEAYPVFDLSSRPVCPMPVAVGMGAAGGAFAGRVAMTLEQIEELRAEDPSAPILLLRPDMVPEDIELVVRVGGVLTGRGGCTSHAAVTARRLGKTAVVDCRGLQVDDALGEVRLAGRALEVGEWLSIDGRTGRVFLGRLDIDSVSGAADKHDFLHSTNREVTP